MKSMLKEKYNKNLVRIIGGKWRSRKLHFDTAEGLRPTKDIVRETLFNWLAPFIVDASCLDLFAGSGALGFEAASRGAKYVLMVDQSKKAMTNLKKNAQILDAKNVEFFLAPAPCGRSNFPVHQFNIVFLDPPFSQGLIAPCCKWLEKNNYLTKDALIYIEAEKSLLIEEAIPNTWKIMRHKISGEVQYCIAEKEILNLG